MVLYIKRKVIGLRNIEGAGNRRKLAPIWSPGPLTHTPTPWNPVATEWHYYPFILGIERGVLCASEPEIGVNWTRFGALVPFPIPLPPESRWGLSGTLPSLYGLQTPRLELNFVTIIHSCRTVGLRKNFVDRPNSYSATHRKNCLVIAQKKLRTVWT